MNPEVLAAYAAGAFGLLVAVLSVSFAYVGQLRVQRAIEASKQSETIRLKALDSIGTVVRALGAISELLRWNIKLEGKKESSDEEIIGRMIRTLQAESKSLLNAYLENQLYIDLRIGRKILSVHGELEDLTLTIEGMKEKKAHIDLTIEVLHAWSNKEFLDLSQEIRTSKAT